MIPRTPLSRCIGETPYRRRPRIKRTPYVSAHKPQVPTLQLDLEDSECEEVEQDQDATRLKPGQEMTLLGSDEELSDISSVSSSEDSSEEDEEDEDEELIDKDLRKQQKKSIFGFQVKDKKRKGG